MIKNLLIAGFMVLSASLAIRLAQSRMQLDKAMYPGSREYMIGFSEYNRGLGDCKNGIIE